ncbi:hypothetical protein Q0Z83_110760 [Actinoplanes sichuanensis]|nr:hypothetical protein Q0Z83_110760 [Actinoplanes sichuanensis]
MALLIGGVEIDGGVVADAVEVVGEGLCHEKGTSRGASVGMPQVRGRESRGADAGRGENRGDRRPVTVFA